MVFEALIKSQMCLISNMPSLTQRVSQENEFLSFGGRTVHVDNIVRLLDFLVDGGAFTLEQSDLYWNALSDHFHYGVLPGMRRFPTPGGPDLYFLPALTVLFDNYIDPPAQIETIRLEWGEEVLSDTDSLTNSVVSDLLGEDLDPDNVIDQMLLDAVELEYRGDDGRDGQDGGDLSQ